MESIPMEIKPVLAKGKFPCFFAAALLAVGIGLSAAQAIDPFYQRLFEDGEAAYIAGDHARAVRSLEVAVFGLAADRVRSARACIYLSLGYSSLKNPDKSLQFLRRAAGLIGDTDPRSLGLAGGAVNAYERLIEKMPSAAEAGRTVSPAWEKPQGTAPPPVTRPLVDPAYVKELEGRLGKEPDNEVLRLDLASLYVSRGDYRRAAKLMRDLLKRDPREIMATYHLSRALFFQKDYREALEGFHKIISPASKEAVTKDTVLRSTIYIALCLDSLGQKQSQSSYMAYLVQNVALTDLKRMIGEEGLQGAWDLLGGH